MFSPVFFFNDTAATEIYTLSLHDALPILDIAKKIRSMRHADNRPSHDPTEELEARSGKGRYERDKCDIDRKSTRLNSSHANISYAVFCLKKKKEKISPRTTRQAKLR